MSTGSNACTVFVCKCNYDTILSTHLYVYICIRVHINEPQPAILSPVLSNNSDTMLTISPLPAQMILDMMTYVSCNTPHFTHTSMQKHRSKAPSLMLSVLCLLGAPLIAVFGNHLAHRSISTQLSSWWLIAGSLSFNIFIACLTVLVLLFCLIYNITVKKIRLIRTKYDKEAAILKCR